MVKTKRVITLLLSAALMLMLTLNGVPSAFAAETDGKKEAGNYDVSASLSCYVSAMGGVEFGKPLLKAASVAIDESGKATMTLTLGKSSVTIYGVTCDTFIDGTVSVPGYYSGGSRASASYTTGSGTALNPDNKSVNYVDSMTFPVDTGVSTYYLYLYVNSNVMGVQFGNGSDTSYVAKLTVDWSTMALLGDRTTATATVVYDYTFAGTYEVSIPSTISVDIKTGTGNYTVQAKKFDIAPSAYVTVTADEAGTLVCAENQEESIGFTNKLAAGQLKKTGDTLSGVVTVAKEPSVEGKYSGTMDFVIKYFPGEAAGK